jgi:hypothetical protein
LTNAVAASCGDPAGVRGAVAVRVVAVVVVVVVGAELDELPARGVESEVQPMNATAHTTAAARQIIEST